MMIFFMQNRTVTVIVELSQTLSDCTFLANYIAISSSRLFFSSLCSDTKYVVTSLAAANVANNNVNHNVAGRLVAIL